ncbi:MAG TPA: phosphatidate cytidylyltransferase [Vicinamibacterales bacterium]|nr:phosphatidate cytidylyltransferase [Vicinamibacterales bacterium]
MVRVLSALVLLPIVLGTIWFLPPIATLLLALAALVVAFFEYADLAARLGAPVYLLVSLVATAATAIAMATPGSPLDVVFISALIVVGGLTVGSGQPDAARLREAAASLFPLIYLGVPIGALVAVRASVSREAVLVLIAIIVISDTGQYYAGRALGRRLLSPSISPKKTVEGAIGGLVAGTAASVALGLYWLPGIAPLSLALLGAALVALGIVGDLFESLLKRSAGVKDSSGLIPGHGGLLDRIDSWLFAAPVYYVFLRYAVMRA